MTPESFLILKTSIFVGYWTDIVKPRSFSEKIIYCKLYRPNPLANVLADKYKVREYVKERVGGLVLNELLWVGEEGSSIPFDELPDKYVVKANHGAGLNIFVRCLDEEKRDEIISTANEWMRKKYGESTRSYELQYDEVKPKIIVERMMEDSTHGIPIDYKFFCFHGIPRYVQVDIDRFDDHRRNIYDDGWNLMPFELHYRNGRSVSRPKKLEKLLQVASDLSKSIDFCRVDLYLVNGTDVRFGEVTLYPGGGFERFFPKRWDFELGRLWDIPEQTND